MLRYCTIALGTKSTVVISQYQDNLIVALLSNPISKCRILKLVDFLSLFCKGDRFCDFLFAFKHTKALLKRVYSIRKELPPACKLFLFGG